MTKVISVKFKGGGKSYYFAPCSQEVQKGMGVIVETSKGLEYAIVTEGVHEVEDESIVPPLMPTVRIATPKDMEQLKKNEERKDEAMKIVREKIEGRQLEMKPVDCEFSFDGSKITVYFTAENRVDFRELIKDLSSAFRMRIELRQIGIREEIKLMGGLAPCGRECCCVRSLQEPKKVSVKMAKNQGLSLNPGKISGLCGRLMCCLSYENDYYAEVCKKVPKLGSEATTPDGKGMVVNVNMLKMIVKVKIENGDSVTYKDFPLDKISFMRGNEVIGTVGGDDEDEELTELVDDSEGDFAVREDVPEAAKGETATGERKNGERRGGDKRNRQGGNAQAGGAQGGEQDREQKQGKKRNKKHKNNGDRGQGSQGGEQGEGGKSSGGASRPNSQPSGQGAPRQNGQGGKRPQQGGKGRNGQANQGANTPNTPNAQNGNNQANNSEGGNQGNSGNQGKKRNKKRRPNKNRPPVQAGAGGAGGDGQKNNA